MSDNTLTTYDEFIDSLNEKIEKLYKKYEIPKIENNLPTKFGNLIEELNEKYKEKTVILIDEYESPILEHINNKEKAEEFRAFLREIYKKVKTKDEYIKKENNKCNTI